MQFFFNFQKEYNKLSKTWVEVQIKIRKKENNCLKFYLIAELFNLLSFDHFLRRKWKVITCCFNTDQCVLSNMYTQKCWMKNLQPCSFHQNSMPKRMLHNMRTNTTWKQDYTKHVFIRIFSSYSYMYIMTFIKENYLQIFIM